jgi:hypothetical protein
MPPLVRTATLRVALARVNDEFSPALTRIPRATKFYDPLASRPSSARRPRGRMGRFQAVNHLRRQIMNTPNDFIAQYEHYKEQLRQVNLTNKTTVFDALEAAKVTSVEVEFDGVGDSGQIDSVTVYQDTTILELPSTPVTFQQAMYGSSEISEASQLLREAIEALCYDYLEQEHGGWENNDGAYGTFNFSVPKRTIELEFNGRFTDVATSYHDF